METTKFGRLRNVIGVVLIVVGLVTLTVIGSFSGYSDATTWAIGLGLIVLGIVVANSIAVANLINDLLR